MIWVSKLKFSFHIYIIVRRTSKKWSNLYYFIKKTKALYGRQILIHFFYHKEWNTTLDIVWYKWDGIQIKIHFVCRDFSFNFCTFFVKNSIFKLVKTLSLCQLLSSVFYLRKGAGIHLYFIYIFRVCYVYPLHCIFSI